MTRHDLVLADVIVGEKAVSRLRIGPIPTGTGNTLTDSLGHHPQQFTKPLGQTDILEVAPPTSLSFPTWGTAARVMVSDLVDACLVRIPSIHHK